MTSIKPPAPGPTGPHSLTDTPDVGSAHKAEGGEATSFQAALENAHQAQQTGQSAEASQTAGTAATSGAAPASATGGDPIAALARDVDAGRVTLDQAVDRLVEQTLTQAQRHLSGEQRAELSGLLREALLHDPTLRALRGEHG